MNKIFDKIDVLQQQLHTLLPMKLEDQQRLDKKFRLEFNYNSNHLEGNTLTYGETELLLIFDDTKGSHTMREYEEMKAHDVAYYLIEDWAKDKERPLTEQSIKELNETILVRPYWKDAITPQGQATRRQIKVGDYKEYPNSVRLQNGEIFEYTAPADTPVKMQELIDWYRQEKNMHPVEIAALLHYKFVCIHPFDDGNGRVSRLLMNYVLLRNNLPPIIIKSEDKANYLRALHLADVGDVAAFTAYIAQQVLWSLDISLKAAKGESIDEVGDVSKELKLLKQKINGVSFYTKSPSLILNTFQYIEKSLIPKLQAALSQFKDLFYEEKIFKLFNGMEEPTQRINIITPFEREIAPNRGIKILGRDIYEEEVETIEWIIKKFGLKNAKAQSDFKILITSHFKKEKYVINFKLDKVKIADLEKVYGQNIDDVEVDVLLALISKALLEAIKLSMEED